MKNSKIKILKIILCLFAMGCKDTSETKHITVSGNLKNLPDGLMTLYQIYPRIDIDSVKTQNGIFSFIIPLKRFTEPTKVAIIHDDKQGVRRLFRHSIKGSPMSTNCFLLEDISIVGVLNESIYKGATSPVLKIVHLDRPIVTGRQTRVMYNDTLSFSTINKIGKLKELINLHPYSYHYLFELKARISVFSNEQFLGLFACFDEDVQKSKTGRELSEYIKNRNTKKLDFTTTLVDRQGQKQLILDKNASLNMVILWASWCGPCRREIPQLKKIRESFASSSKLSMVSVSVDDNKENWHKALDKEQMPWRQLLITPEATAYSKELLNFDGSIPTTLFVNNQGKIIKKFVGYDEKGLEEFKKLIAEH